MKRFKPPKRPQWYARAKALVEESEPWSKQSVLRLLKSVLQSYDAQFASLVTIANHLTTDEGDAKATEEAFGLSAREVVEMAHDDMVNAAREALRPRRENQDVRR
ncbi:MAG: hypothetical protein ABFD89_17520 [Bryobacteraceae bacterium]